MMDKAIYRLASKFVPFTIGYVDEQIKDEGMVGMCSIHKWDQKWNA
jgi:hypothetical protein